MPVSTHYNWFDQMTEVFIYSSGIIYSSELQQLE